MNQVTNHRSLRRGAILGLSIAEAFMLIAFILLFLFALWQKESQLTTDKDLDQSIRVLVKTAEIRNLSDALKRMSRDDFVAMLEMSVSLSLRKLRDTERFLKDKSEEELSQLMNLVRENTAFSDDDQLDAVMRSLTSAIENSQLAESIKNKPLDDLIAKLEVADKASLNQLKRTLDFMENKSERELTELMNLVRDEQGLRNEIREQLQKYSQDRARLAEELEKELGDLVRGMQGDIDDTGRISLPNEVLFSAGEASLRPAMQQFLQIACEPWLRTLSAANVDLSEIRIEGHASREWSGATSASEAFLNNLDLSQRRAQTVLAECVSVTKNQEIKSWAQKYLTAIGYSSSRPVLSKDDGRELLEESRRVVFGVQLDAEKALRDIDSKVRN